LRPIKPQPMMAKPVGREGATLGVDIDRQRLGWELAGCRV